MTYFYIFLCAFMFSLLFVRLSILVSARFKKCEKKGVPCLGGAGIYAAFLTATLAGLFLKELYGLRLFGLMFSSGLALILGIVDDIKDLRPFAKIIVEIFAALVLAGFGVVTKIMFLPVWANLAVTILWVVLITNAVNLLDIMDGLASGLVIIISATLLAVSLVNQDMFSAFILIALIGAHLGFLKYNYPPAKVYMGDAGSLFSGFLLAALAINISYAPFDRPVALMTPVVALILLIYDTLFLVIMRLRNRKPIFSKTNDHLALRLMTMGYSTHKSLWIMYLFSAFLAISALIVAFGSNAVGIVMLAIVILVLILMGKRAGIVRIE